MILLPLIMLTRPASGGPPFLTDDPETLPPKNWELYLAHTYNKVDDGISGTAPHLELNYGVMPNLQLHMIIPLVYNKPKAEPTLYGFGDLELGVLYRFIQETDTRPMVGIFPLVHFPTGDEDRGLGTGHPHFFLPIWLKKSWGPWTTYGGGGYWIYPGTNNKNYWYLGWVGQREVAKWLTLGAEIFYVTPPTKNSSDEVGYNIGGYINFTPEHHLIFSAGSDIHGAASLRYYVGYYRTWGPSIRTDNGNNKKEAGR